jgi:hypothetical protein
MSTRKEREYWNKRRELNDKMKDFRDKYFPQKKYGNNNNGGGSSSETSPKDIFLIILFFLFIGPFILLFYIIKFIITHKPVLIIVIIGIAGFFIANNTILKKPSPIIENTEIVIENEPVIIEENETEWIGATDIEPVVKEGIFKKVGNYLTGRGFAIRDFFVNEYYPKIADISRLNNLLYVVGYGFIALWLGLGGLFLAVFLGRAVIAVFNRRKWGKAGGSLASSVILIGSGFVLYYVFRGPLERQITGTLAEKIFMLIFFGLFILSNVIVIVMLRVKNKKAKIGSVIKMVIVMAIVYIAVTFTRGIIG